MVRLSLPHLLALVSNFRLVISFCVFTVISLFVYAEFNFPFMLNLILRRWSSEYCVFATSEGRVHLIIIYQSRKLGISVFIYANITTFLC